ncbi:hypothetical protein JCM10512_4803 [Bacteroides reticulotermitis JCM 10512]|uniref:Uncharacterized protein n=1 Tax=Bacteroides reticulotermitis JCM 10512 TaxID=1445607 RepID=W4UYG1_9BACE|nr:hypothetical protein JCM10512_4803 [Bacteroides reticulotermitis JCM 10512]
MTGRNKASNLSKRSGVFYKSGRLFSTGHRKNPHKFDTFASHNQSNMRVKRCDIHRLIVYT